MELMNNGIINFSLEGRPEHRSPESQKPNWVHFMQIQAISLLICRVEPATVVLPTGTGKTETMLATMIYQRCEAILLIVPSDSLPNTNIKNSLSWDICQELTVVPPNIALPNVAIIKKGIPR